MTEQESGLPKAEDVAAVDALYRPFPDFSSWPRLGPMQRDLWARFSTELGQLASPVTGGGVSVARFSQLFLLAAQEGHEDPARYVWDLLSGQGHRLIKEGKIIEDAEGNMAELKSLHETFLEQQLPVLRQLKVA